jgi:hypothetical protein
MGAAKRESKTDTNQGIKRRSFFSAGTDFYMDREKEKWKQDGVLIALVLVVLVMAFWVVRQQHHFMFDANDPIVERVTFRKVDAETIENETQSGRLSNTPARFFRLVPNQELKP